MGAPELRKFPLYLHHLLWGNRRQFHGKSHSGLGAEHIPLQGFQVDLKRWMLVCDCPGALTHHNLCIWCPKSRKILTPERL